MVQWVCDIKLIGIPYEDFSNSEDDANIFTNFIAYYFEVVLSRKGRVDDYCNGF